jgi:hypothetical protein
MIKLTIFEIMINLLILRDYRGVTLEKCPYG